MRYTVLVLLAMNVGAALVNKDWHSFFGWLAATSIALGSINN